MSCNIHIDIYNKRIYNYEVFIFNVTINSVKN